MSCCHLIFAGGDFGRVAPHTGVKEGSVDLSWRFCAQKKLDLWILITHNLKKVCSAVVSTKSWQNLPWIFFAIFFSPKKSGLGGKGSALRRQNWEIRCTLDRSWRWVNPQRFMMMIHGIPWKMGVAVSNLFWWWWHCPGLLLFVVFFFDLSRKFLGEKNLPLSTDGLGGGWMHPTEVWISDSDLFLLQNS